MTPHQKVQTSFNQCLSLVTKGSHPTEALYKVAQRNDLNQNFIQRVAGVLNAALTHDHFKKAADRSTDFEIADAKDVTKRLFEKEKVASVPTIENKHIDFNKIIAKKFLNQKQKFAAVEPERITGDFTEIYIKAASYVRGLKQEAENEKVAEIKHFNDAFSLAAGLIKHFTKTANRNSFADFESEVLNKYAECHVKDYLDVIYDGAKLKEPRGSMSKTASVFEKKNQCRETDMFESFLVAQDRYKEAGDKARYVNFEYEFEKERLKHAASITKDSTPDEVLTSIKEQLKTPEVEDVKEASDKGDKKPGFFEQVVNPYKAIGNFLSGKKEKEETPDVKYPMSGKDNIERGVLLQDLMLNDPIIKHESPRRVAEIYEQIVRLAPQVASQKEVVRAQMRLGLASQGGIDINNAETLTKANKGLVENYHLLQGHPYSRK